MQTALAMRLDRRKERFHARFFESLLRHQLIYNACWEDPALDRTALQLNRDDRVLVITSAGCNALDYLLAGAGEIHAVDVNPCQNALLELKRAGIRTLSHEAFFELFGRGWSPRARRLYGESLRPELSPRARKFWDRRIGFFDRPGWRQSFYYRGTSGLFARLIVDLVRGLKSLDGPVDELLRARTIDEQRRIYEAEMRDRLWTPWMRWFLSRRVTLSLIGIPRGQHGEMLDRFPGGAADYIRDCFETVITRLPFRDNYFWRVYFTGSYEYDACPEYLKPGNFERLKDRIDRVKIHTSTVTDCLRRTRKPFSRYVLLDHLDWMRSYPELLAEEWSALLEHARPGARAIFRSAGRDAAFLWPTRVAGDTLGDLLQPYPELAARLHARDRVHTYGSFHIVDLPS